MNSLIRVQHSIHRRFRRARPGSVLILVVALLMLMAVIGTAYISSARSDRYSAAQNAANTEIDMLVQGVISLAEGKLLGDLFNPTFHGTSYDYPAATNSLFLADRHPTLADLTSTPTAPGGGNPPIWRFISASPIGNGFEAPFSSASTAVVKYTNRSVLIPSSVAVTINGTPQIYPAFHDMTTGLDLLAADTDGDGIADAGLFRLPIGEINGVTYYGAIRVIDNASAVNAAIAWEPNASVTFAGNFFPVNVNLRDLLNSADLPANFTAFNTNARFGPPAACSLTPVDDATVPNLRGDFVFISQYDAFWSQLGRRLLNPGWNTTAKYQALSMAESSQMAHRFILRDPGVPSASQSPSLLEQNLQASVFSNSQSTPYAPGNAVAWYNGNFDFVTGNMPQRSSLVARNGVTNYCPSRLTSRGAWSNPPIVGPAFYSFGDWVSYNGIAYVCLTPTVSVAPAGDASSSICWEPQPWLNAPLKASVNTATFGQLWAAYWSVMDNPDTAASTDKTLAGVPIVGVPPTSPTPPAAGSISRIFRSSLRDPNATPTKSLVPAVEMQLRSAIAAAQTEQLRANPYGQFATASPTPSGRIYSHLVRLADPTTGSTLYDVMVYGTAMQPYITEVYANNDTTTPDPNGGGVNPEGYVAIELFNPSSVPVTLTNWNIGVVDRRTTTYPGMAMVPLSSNFAGFGTASPPTIPANGFLVLENFSASGNGDAAKYRPYMNYASHGAAPTSTYYVPDLHKVMLDGVAAAWKGGEMFLLRPRRQDGVLQTGPTATNNSANVGLYDPTNPYDEANLEDLVPVDSFDFFPMTVTAGQMDGLMAIHYLRENAVNHGWKWVYPGRWTANASFRQEGTMQSNWATGIPDPWIAAAPTPAIALGLADGTSSYANTLLGIQMGAIDYAGPYPVAGSGNQFPFGGFARNVDIMQVPYIGAYRIRLTGASSGLMELNTVSADASLADDLDDSDNAAENVGRFAPIHPNDLSTAKTFFDETAPVNDYHDAGALTSGSGDWADKWRYHWALGLLDFLTVQAPHDDYFPNAPISDKFGPRPDSIYRSPATSPTYVAYSGGGYAPVGTLDPVANGTNSSAKNATVADHIEETATVHGLININTASWRILATLPMITAIDNTNTAQVAAATQANNDLAKLIVKFRDVDDGSGASPAHPHGAFKSIFELNLVPGFRNSVHTANDLNVQTADPDDLDGDLSPFNYGGPSATDNVKGDFESQNLALNRISNLITTRSDSFTAYVLVQGWRGIGTSQPELVVQRRSALILDRSPANLSNRSMPAAMTTTNVPVN